MATSLEKKKRNDVLKKSKYKLIWNFKKEKKT